MGRVRRYRKIKACDPFSKKKSTGNESLDYDEPPDLFEQRTKKRKRATRDWDDELQREKLLQEQALRELKSANAAEKSKVNIEPIKPGESLKKFEKRVREETKRVLNDEVTKLTSTAKRRKEKMKERKQKLKEKKKHKDSDDEEEIHFGSRHDGYIRPSDRGDVNPYFATHDNFAFGESAEKPPELDSWKEKLDKKKKIIPQKRELNLKLQAKLSSTEDVPSHDNSIELEKLRKQAIEAYKQLREKRRKLSGNQ